MSDQQIPEDWKRAAAEAAKCFSVARAIERKQCPEGAAPGVLAGLVVAVALVRQADFLADIRDEIKDSQSAILDALIEIGREASRIVVALGD